MSDVLSKTDLQTKQQGAVTYSTPDPKDEKELLERIKDRVRIHEPEMKELREIDSKNQDYYYARYIDPRKLRKGEDNIMIPKAFENWETLVPIITRTTPEPNVTVVQKERSRTIISSFLDLVNLPKKKTRLRLQELLPYYLKDKWQLSKVDGGANVQPKMEENFRNLASQRTMIFKLRINPKFSVLEPVVVSVNDCIFAKDTEDDSELDFFGHYCTYTLGELKKMNIPEQKIQELVEKVTSKEPKGVSDKTVIKMMEYWEPEQVALQYNEEIVLKTFPNPLYNWKDESFNHFSKPLIPVIIETDIKQNSGLVGSASYIEVGKSLLESIDKRKRQVNRNAKLANGIIVVDGTAISKEDSRNLATDSDKTLWMEPNSGVTAASAVNILTARPIDQAIVNDMVHTEGHYDKLTGVNDTIRGDRTAQETAEGRKLLKESALSRNEILFRVNERVGQKFFNWTIQALYCTCSDEGAVVYSSAGVYNSDNLITRDMLKGNKILCYVRDGSTIPVDKSTVEAEAVERYKLGLYSRKKTLELLGDPDPDKTARERYLEDEKPEELYDRNFADNKNDPLAMMHIYDLIKGDVMPHIQSFQTPQQAEKYLQTFNDYMDNKEIDDDLPSYSSLDTEIKRRLQVHIDEASKKIAEFVASQGSILPPQDPQPDMPVEEPQPDMPVPVEEEQIPVAV